MRMSLGVASNLRFSSSMITLQQNYCMKKISLFSPDQIRKHLANKSKTKVAFAFAKTKRFTEPNPEQVFYSNSCQLSKRKTSLGYGTRSDFTRSTAESPGSAFYKHKSQFEQMSKTFSFGLSRQKQPDRSYLIPQLQKVPGPGQYENQIKTRSPISYSHRAKTIDVVQKHLTFLEVPGPGKYEATDLNPKGGRFKVSKFSDTIFAKINLGLRFKPTKFSTPGSNAYRELDSLNSQAKYILSHRRGKGTRPFDREKKFKTDFWKTNQNPGPGKYEKPSEFGVYGDSEYYKTLALK